MIVVGHEQDLVCVAGIIVCAHTTLLVKQTAGVGLPAYFEPKEGA